MSAFLLNAVGDAIAIMSAINCYEALRQRRVARVAVWGLATGVMLAVADMALVLR